VSGDVAVVSLAGDDDVDNESGAAYVFRFDGDSWVEEDKFTPRPEDVQGSSFNFAWSVAVSGDVVVVGS
jgi:hypothetical protein